MTAIKHMVIVQQKRRSDKMSWCCYDNPKKFDNITAEAKCSGDAGRPYRFIYRINVRLKESIQ